MRIGNDARSVEGMLLLPMVILIGIGWVMVFSTALPGPGGSYRDVIYLLGRQVLATGLGALGLMAAVRVNMPALIRSAPTVLAITASLMLVVFVPGLGKSVARATRWINMGVITFQPVEVFKLAVVLCYAWLLARERPRENWSRKTWLKIGGLAAVSVILPMLQRDFGSVVLMLGLGGAMLWLAGVRTGFLLAFGGAAAAAATAMVLSAPYRMDRIKIYFLALGSGDGGGYQTRQSLIALGAGGLFGVGLGESGQKLYYLPLAHADFIYAIIGEEGGFIGALATLALYLFLMHQGLRVSMHATSRFCRLLSAGLTLLIFTQAIWHIAVSLALVPTKGLALPFVSYGGSSLMGSMLAVGLILRCAMEISPEAIPAQPAAAAAGGGFQAGV